MQDTWRDNQGLIEDTNTKLAAAGELQTAWETARQGAADALGELGKVMLTQAQKIYGEQGIRVEPIVAAGLLTGMKIWVHETCHIFKKGG